MHIFANSLYLRWFLCGFIFSIPIRWFLFPASQTKKASDTRWTVNTIVLCLNMVILIGSLAFTLYGNYLTSLQGAGSEVVKNMTSENATAFFTGQVQTFNHAVIYYVAFLYLIIGIVVGLGLWQMVLSFWRWYKARDISGTRLELRKIDTHAKNTITSNMEQKQNSTNLNIDLKIDSADIAKMDNMQRLDMGLMIDRIDRLKNKDTREQYNDKKES